MHCRGAELLHDVPAQPWDPQLEELAPEAVIVLLHVKACPLPLMLFHRHMCLQNAEPLAGGHEQCDPTLACCIDHHLQRC